MNKRSGRLLLAFSSLATALSLAAFAQGHEVRRIDFDFKSLGNPKEIQGILRELGDRGLDRSFTGTGAPAEEKGHAVFTFFNADSWIIGLSVDGGVLPAGALPGGTVEIEFRDTGRNATLGNCPYLLRFPLSKPPARKAKRAPNPAWWLYRLERRYADPGPGPGVVPLMTFGKGYPAPSGADTLLVPRDEGGWFFLVRIKWGPLYGRWPFARPGVADTWRLRLTRTTRGGSRFVWGATEGTGRIRWPKTAPDTMESFCKSMGLPEAIKRYEEELALQRDIYMAAVRDKHFGHVKTPGPCFHRHDPESSALFLKAVLDRIERGDANLLEAVRPGKKGQPPRLFSQPEAIKGKLMSELGRILYVDETVDRARRDFLRNELLGRKTKAPDADAAKKKTGDADDLDAIWNGGGEQIQLDDLAF